MSLHHASEYQWCSHLVSANFTTSASPETPPGEQMTLLMLPTSPQPVVGEETAESPGWPKDHQLLQPVKFQFSLFICKELLDFGGMMETAHWQLYTLAEGP